MSNSFNIACDVAYTYARGAGDMRLTQAYDFGDCWVFHFAPIDGVPRLMAMNMKVDKVTLEPSEADENFPPFLYADNYSKHERLPIPAEYAPREGECPKLTAAEIAKAAGWY